MANAAERGSIAVLGVKVILVDVLAFRPTLNVVLNMETRFAPTLNAVQRTATVVLRMLFAQGKTAVAIMAGVIRNKSRRIIEHEDC